MVEEVERAGRGASSVEVRVHSITPGRRMQGRLSFDGEASSFFLVERDRFSVVGARALPLGQFGYVVDLRIPSDGPAPSGDPALRRRLAEELVTLLTCPAAPSLARPGETISLPVSGLLASPPTWRADVRFWGEVRGDYDPR